MAEFFDVRVSLHRSRRLAIWLIVVHLGALAMMAGVSSALPWAGLAFPVIAVSLGYAWQHHYRLEYPAAIVAVRHRHGWVLDTRDGRSFAANLHGPQWVSAWLVVLVFRAGASKARYRVIVLPDQTDRVSFRRLIRTVRWMAAPGDAEGTS
ncbi:MAG: protein YgfX [Pseudomonadales bacterium]